jgi:hypothetical protein
MKMKKTRMRMNKEPCASTQKLTCAKNIYFTSEQVAAINNASKKLGWNDFSKFVRYHSIKAANEINNQSLNFPILEPDFVAKLKKFFTTFEDG